MAPLAYSILSDSLGGGLWNIPNGSLDIHLFGTRRALTWGVRYKIALGVARTLRYLHEDTKLGNVLLDTDFNTEFSDFGIAKSEDTRLRSHNTIKIYY
uniref:Cysteine-rich receptor-like protein kinase 37 n=1 Tax=Cajanus cajan TaxID=3821 RepID=A0A151QZ53_CAJCA|nr:Cysteine-rich receptor-like protein kinase 37 [Cajanus cajan]